MRRGTRPLSRLTSSTPLSTCQISPDVVAAPFLGAYAGDCRCSWLANSMRSCRSRRLTSWKGGSHRRPLAAVVKFMRTRQLGVRSRAYLYRGAPRPLTTTIDGRSVNQKKCPKKVSLVTGDPPHVHQVSGR